MPASYFQRHKTCEVCGNGFGTYTSAAKYCSDACKQAAYRERKKQRRIADKRTMSMDDYMLIKSLLEWHADAANVLDHMQREYGQSAMLDAAHFAAWVGGIGPHS